MSNDSKELPFDKPNKSLNLSVEETNKVREKLGLKPLSTSAAKDDVQNVQPKTGQEPSTEEIRHRVDSSRARRAREHILQEGQALLRDIVESPSADSLSWLKDVGKFIQPETTEDQVSEDVSVPGHVRVSHHMKNVVIKTGETLPFTLKDTTILDENKKLRSDDLLDLLENEELCEQEKREKRQREKKFGGYDPVEGEDYDQNDLDETETFKEAKCQILPHYDQWAIENRTVPKPANHDLKGTFTIDQFQQQPEYQKVDMIEPVTLTSESGLQRDFYTHEEYTNVMKESQPAIRNIKKKLRLRRTTQDPDDDHKVDDNSILKTLKKAGLQQTKVSVSVSGVQQEEDDDEHFYAQLAKNKVIKPLVKVENCKSNLNSVVQMVDIIGHLERAEQHPDSGLQSVGVVDIKSEESVPNLPSSIELSEVTEFCRAVQTPLERLEEIRSVVSYQPLETLGRSKRGIAVKNQPERQTSSGKDMAKDQIDQPDKALEEEDDDDEIDDELPEKDKELLEQLLSENVLDGTVTSALAFLKSKGQLSDDKVTRRGHRGDEHQPLHISTQPGDIKLEYRDDYGKIMTPKEAFRYISWVFHGKGPGKRKLEKMMRKMELEKKRKIVGANQNELPTMMALQKHQKKDQSYLVLNNLPTT